MTEALRQTPFLDEEPFTPDATHCFNCGVAEVSVAELLTAGTAIGQREIRVLKYRSVYPLVMLYVEYENGRLMKSNGSNGDYQVCVPCYRLQFAEYYPKFECPV